MSDLDDLKLLEILPSSIAEDEQIRAIAETIQPDLDGITSSIPLIELYGRIDELPEPVLRMLAWENRVYSNEWALAKNIEAKRDLVKNAFELNQRRGTRFSVERVLELLDFTASLEEWFEYGGAPYRFRINILDVSEDGITLNQLQLLNRLIDQYKPVRSALDVINYTLAAEQVSAYQGLANTMYGALSAYAYVIESRSTQVDANGAVSRSLGLTLEVRPNTN